MFVSSPSICVKLFLSKVTAGIVLLQLHQGLLSHRGPARRWPQSSHPSCGDTGTWPEGSLSALGRTLGQCWAGGRGKKKKKIKNHSLKSHWDETVTEVLAQHTHRDTKRQTWGHWKTPRDTHGPADTEALPGVYRHPRGEMVTKRPWHTHTEPCQTASTTH